MISAPWMRSRGKDGDGLVATLHGPCHVNAEVNGVAVSIVEKTHYPFSFDIELSIETERPVEFPLRLRVPAWSEQPSVDASDAVVTCDQRGMLVVRKQWKTGDKVHLTLEPKIHGQTAVDGTTAVAYGPLVFCLPIAEKAQVVGDFPHAGPNRVSGFRAYQYDPADLTSAKRPLQGRKRCQEPLFGGDASRSTQIT